MLRSSFLHLHGFGKAKEEALWKRGIRTWDDFLAVWRRDMPLLGPEARHPDLEQSYSALRRHDVGFFASALPRQEHYRIALEYPQDTLFLDIETTGLSHYYDRITLVGWSFGERFGVYIAGQDRVPLLEAFASAKALVTFNGTMFDLRFIRNEFPDAIIPPVHIDLRFLAKRVGLTGGQKSIEQQIGLVRTEAKGISGEAAPVLWHCYRRGDIQALKELIRYNHADVEGMKSIFDYCMKLLAKRGSLPDRPALRFKKLKSKVVWAKAGQLNQPYAISVAPWRDDDTAYFSLSDLSRQIPFEDVPIVGIDLVASESKGTGYALVKGQHTTTQRVFSDDEILALVQQHKARLVSIDSPLSLPFGRMTVFDDDPNREEFGIMRICERQLKRRGINVYPSLIRCMQKLTRRGMELAQKIRSLGIPVIESYPGAAQDIMRIPRKQAGLDWLRLGLAEFGLTGEFLHVDVSHDELDAITSAVVGQFFWAGKYEGLGTAEEDYLIIPDQHVDNSRWLSRTVVGFSGSIGVGKTTAAQFLAREKGFVLVRYSDVLVNILRQRGQKPTRSALQKLGWEVHTQHGQRWLGRQLVALAGDAEKIVVDGVRFPEDAAYLRESYGPRYLHCHIECPAEIARQRTQDAPREDISAAQALEHPVEQRVDFLQNLANKILNNQSSLGEFYAQLESL